MAEGKKWIVTLSSERPLGDVRRDLSGAGFKIDQVLEEIGVVTGECEPDVAEKVRGVKGVADISADAPIDLGPPDSPTTW
jgi:hypothetical protein